MKDDIGKDCRLTARTSVWEGSRAGTWSSLNPVERILQMLISRSYSESDSEQGSSPTDFAELRSLLAHPADMGDEQRQRLMVLARRLARVRALGDEYHRVDLSDYAMDTLLNETAVI